MNIPPISDPEVIVSGAGPVGLFLACELALAGCSVLVLEKSTDPDSPLKRLPFGMRGLSAPTVEALQRRGLLDEFELHQRLKNPHANAISGPRRQVGHFAGIPLQEGLIDVSRWTDRLPGSPPAQIMTEMAEVESILARRAESQGVEVRRGVGVTGFQQGEDGVLVRAGQSSVRCQWLVGCDGGRSLVRREAGIEFAGTEPEFTGYSVQADFVDAEELQPGRHLTEKGMYFQSQPGFLIIQDFDGGAGHGAEPPLLEQVQSVLRRVSGTDVIVQALHAATTWTDRARQATTYRKGRVLVAGDAAHIHAPLGGQGLNLGLGDAMNLGWKLAATIQGRAPEGLLDTYEAERHPIGVRVLDWSRAQVAIMRPDPAARALNAIMRDLIDTPDGATYMASRVWGVNTFYPAESDHRLVGHSVPNFEFQDGVCLGERMREGEGMLLDFDDDPALASIASAYDLLHITGSVKESLGVHAALIRPDGMIAWASDQPSPDMSELQQAVARWFTTST